jgi:hypothetical protein
LETVIPTDPIEDIFGENKDERRKEKEKAIKNLKIGFFLLVRH